MGARERESGIDSVCVCVCVFVSVGCLREGRVSVSAFVCTCVWPWMSSICMVRVNMRILLC